MKPLLFIHLLSLLILLFQPTSAIDFIFNGFNFSNLLFYGTATIESRIVSLTNQAQFSIGRVLYPTKIQTKKPNSSYVYPFSTSFIFSMVPSRNFLAGHGFVLIFVPLTGIEGATSAQNLGLFNGTNDGDSSGHVFGIEFDVFKNKQFNDIDDNHVGIDVNSLTSKSSHAAGYWPDDITSDDEKLFKKLKLNNGENYQVWIDYKDSLINVSMALAGMRRPKRNLLSVSLNLSGVFEDQMYVGFTASTGQLVESHKILAWSFSNSSFSLSEKLITAGLPSFVLPKIPFFKSKSFIAGTTVGGFIIVAVCVLLSLFLIRRIRRKARERAEMEDWELEYWPHRITYQEIEAATKGFSEENVIGIGAHPTFEEIRQGNSSSMSFSWSNTTLQGR
ncbi:hypothetical protein QYF36_021200 [Acer negundo]|nr:hypothetical protein QYF36_021200 [Acer negundo]